MKLYEEHRERRKQELKEIAAKHIEEIHMKQVITRDEIND